MEQFWNKVNHVITPHTWPLCMQWLECTFKHLFVCVFFLKYCATGLDRTCCSLVYTNSLYSGADVPSSQFSICYSLIDLLGTTWLNINIFGVLRCLKTVTRTLRCYGVYATLKLQHIYLNWLKHLNMFKKGDQDVFLVRKQQYL